MSKPPPLLAFLTRIATAENSANHRECHHSPGSDATPYSSLISGDAEVNVKKFDTNATPSASVKFTLIITWPE